MRGEHNYRIINGMYVLHAGDEPIGVPLLEVSIALDREHGVLHKHGAPDLVQQWVDSARASLRNVDAAAADALVTVQGRFPVEELNRCLSNRTYVVSLWEQVMAQSLPQLPAPG